MICTILSIDWDLGGEITGRVYYGDPVKIKDEPAPIVGTVRAKEVYEAIPAYKKILEEGVDKDSARYQKLMLEATKAFKAALSHAAVSHLPPLLIVVEEGGSSGYPIVDITDIVIKKVPQ